MFNQNIFYFKDRNNEMKMRSLIKQKNQQQKYVKKKMDIIIC